MTVFELIEILKAMPPDAEIKGVEHVTLHSVNDHMFVVVE